MEICDEAAKQILQCIEAAIELEGKSGKELAHLVDDHLMNELAVTSPQFTLLSEICCRLKRYDKLIEAAEFVKTRLPKLHAQSTWLLEGFSALHDAMIFEPDLEENEEPNSG